MDALQDEEFCIWDFHNANIWFNGTKRVYRIRTLRGDAFAVVSDGLKGMRQQRTFVKYNNGSSRLTVGRFRALTFGKGIKQCGLCVSDIHQKWNT